MREIKFRAWSIERNLMIYPDNNGWYDGAFTHENGHLQTVQLATVVKDERLVALQYTGLNDVEGREIYEGDILTYGYVVTFVDGSDSANLGMEAGWYEQRDNFESFRQLIVGEPMEVIGNIYENRHLLEDDAQ